MKIEEYIVETKKTLLKEALPNWVLAELLLAELGMKEPAKKKKRVRRTRPPTPAEKANQDRFAEEQRRKALLRQRENVQRGGDSTELQAPPAPPPQPSDSAMERAKRELFDDL